MCGIYGVQSRTMDVSEHDGIRYILKRGPDYHGSWVDPNKVIKLQHARLSIIDLSNLGNQPMHSLSGRVSMVFNGEIYNFEDLKKTYLSSRPLRSKSDSEVLLELFDLYGPQCLTFLNGIFAVAFWEKDKEILTIARDHMGVKPLYYSHKPNSFCFSSEMKAILRSGFVSAELSPYGVMNHLQYVWSPGETTISENIKKVLPGYYFQIKDGQVISKTKFLDINLEKQTEVSFKEAKETLVEMIKESVKRQMISDVPVGTFLSGGMDSSVISYFAALQLKENGNTEKLQCFTLDSGSSSDGFEKDLPYAKKVSDFIGAELNVISADSATYIDLLSEMVYDLDEPTADFAALNTAFIAKIARANGIKVLLSGAGGDDILSGYRRHSALSVYASLSQVPLPIIDMVRKLLGYSNQQSILGRRLTKLMAMYDPNINVAIENLFEWQTRTSVYALLSNEYRSLIEHSPRENTLRHTLAWVPSNVSELDKMLYVECRHFLADHNLNYTDKMSMKYGVETRVPFLDRDLVDYCFSMPQSFKLNKGRSKYILKKSMERYLPHEIIYRSKTGFGVNLNSWTNGGQLNELYEDLFSSQSISKRGIFNFDGIRTLRNKTNNIEAAYTLLGAASIELWCRQFIDGDYSI